MPQVSVIIPTYNRRQLVSRAIESVLGQTYSNYEILVVDDGSTDYTAEVIKNYGHRVRYFYQSNLGMGGSYARNLGIKEARGEYIAFLDSDDEWLPEKLERQIEIVSGENGPAWIYCDLETVEGDNGEKAFLRSQIFGMPSGDILRNLFQRQFLATSTIVVRKTVFDEVGGFWPSPKATDWDMWLRIASVYQIGYVQDVLVKYQIHPNRVTDNLSGEKTFQAVLAVLNRAVERDPDRLSPYKQKAEANLNLTTGMFLTTHGNLREARTYFKQAIPLSPMNLRAYIYYLSTFMSWEAFKRLNKLRRKYRSERSGKRQPAEWDNV